MKICWFKYPAIVFAVATMMVTASSTQSVADGVPSGHCSVNCQHSNTVCLTFPDDGKGGTPPAKCYPSLNCSNTPEGKKSLCAAIKDFETGPPPVDCTSISVKDGANPAYGLDCDPPPPPKKGKKGGASVIDLL